MSKYELCNILLKWLQTFQIDNTIGSYETLDDLTDGVVMAQVLHQIAPEWFSNNWLAKIKPVVGENWRLKVSNLKKLIEGVTDYYQEYVNPRIDFVKPDAIKIGEHKDPSELVKLLQLILGCAVNCNRKQEYIKEIMLMEESVQNVIMQSIQELENLLGSAPLSFSSSLNIDSNVQIEQLVSELQLASEARDRLSQKCNELDVQLSVLQEEKNAVLEDKNRLEERLQELLVDPIKDNVLRKQIDALKEEIFKLETSRDDYRLKLELQEKEMTELQVKFDSLQQMATEARHLKDELDILREDADKVEKLESTLSSYKKKLEELSELKREKKLLEDRNLTYVRQTLELQEELKKANTWRTQAEIYKKQVAELRNNLSEETKKLDKMEFDNMKTLEKLNAVQQEKERLVVERDALKETNEELLCGKFQLKENSSDLSMVEVGKSSNVSDGMMSMIELKRELVKLQHENRMLKVNQRESEDEKLALLRRMFDDKLQEYNQLQTNYRQANQRILQLEAELKEMNDSKNQNNSALVKEVQMLSEVISSKDQEYDELEDKYRKCVEKARCVAKSLDFPELQPVSEQINLLRGKVSEKDHILKEVEKQFMQHELRKDTEAKLLASAFYNFAQKKQHESMDQRLINSNAVTGNLSFLARQRQSAPRRIPVPYNSK